MEDISIQGGIRGGESISEKLVSMEDALTQFLFSLFPFLISEKLVSMEVFPCFLLSFFSASKISEKLVSMEAKSDN